MKVRRSWCLLAGTVLGLVYFFYLLFYEYAAHNSPQEIQAIGGQLTRALTAPHIIVVALAVLFGLAAYLGRAVWAAWAAAGLYLAGGLLCLPQMVYVLPSLVLCVVGGILLHKRKREHFYTPH